MLSTLTVRAVASATYVRLPYVATADGLAPLPNANVLLTANVDTAGNTATDTVTGVDTCPSLTLTMNVSKSGVDVDCAANRAPVDG